MASVLSPQALLHLLQEHKGYRAAARACGMSHSSVMQAVRGYIKTGELSRNDIEQCVTGTRLPEAKTVGLAQEQGSEIEVCFGDKHGSCTVVSHIKTLEDALEYAQVDLLIWEPDRAEVTKWGQKEGVDLWRVNVKLRRRQDATANKAMERLLADLKASAPRPVPVKRQKPREDVEEVLAEVGFTDEHAGLYAIPDECGSFSDMKTWISDHDAALERFCEVLRHENVTRIALPLGSDLFHAESRTNMTPKSGNLLDVDGRHSEIYLEVARQKIKAIETLRQFAPVSAFWVRGNHCEDTSWHLCHYLHGYFSRYQDVSIDLGRYPRKYLEWGTVLIGWCHLDQEDIGRLPALVASEMPESWARTTVREMHGGHTHAKREIRYKAVGDVDGFGVRTFRALSRTDSYHAGKGYVGRDKGAELYLWGKQSGLRSYHPFNVHLDFKLHPTIKSL